MHRENSISPWFIRFWCSNCSYLLQVFKHLSLTNKNNLRQIFIKKVTNEKRGNILSTFSLFNPLCWAFLKFFECACNESCEVGMTCCAYKHVWQVIFIPKIILTDFSPHNKMKLMLKPFCLWKVSDDGFNSLPRCNKIQLMIDL